MVNYMAEDRPAMAVTARVLSQRMAAPTRGTEYRLKREVRYLASYPHRDLACQELVEYSYRIWSNKSVWAGGVTSRKSCIGWYTQRNGGRFASGTRPTHMLCCRQEKWSGTAQQGIPEGLRVRSRPGASACNGMLLRTGAGHVKHLGTKRLWAQGPVPS